MAFSPLPPTSPSEARFFTNATDALAHVKEIYAHNASYLKEQFGALSCGRPLGEKIEACYPYVAITVADEEPPDSALSYGFVASAGRFSTTLTRPDLFEGYLLEQFEHLLSNHKVPLEVGVSAVPIPIHFVFQNGDHLEGALDSAKLQRLRRCFSLPNLALMDDSIANGTHAVHGNEQPLALFTAPRIDYSLQRLRHYTGTDPAQFQNLVIFTNYPFYVDEFVRLGNAMIEKGEGLYNKLVCPVGAPQMPAYHLQRPDGNGITMINIGVGPSNARNMSDHVAVLRPDAWLMLGHCAGLQRTQKLGDYVLAHAYVREDRALDDELPLWVPIPALAEVQRALEGAVMKVTGLEGREVKSVMRTGTVVSTDNRNWEIAGYTDFVKRFSQSRAIALDMESATIAANGFRFRIPYGTLLCVSDRPLHGEIKLPGMASEFYRRQVDQHLLIGIRAMEQIRDKTGLEHLHSRKLRSFFETAFQ
jgi:AMP nucleosidase